MTRFLVVPQWQGSASARAMQLVDGALAIAGDLPRSASTTLEVPAHAGESLDSGVHRLSALQATARAQVEALGRLEGPVLTVGGDAGVAATAALAATGALAGAPDPGAVVVWFSAHADLHDPGSSPTGSFDTMAVRSLVDPQVPRPAGGDAPHSQVVLAGVRTVDAAEQAASTRFGVDMIAADALSPVSVADAARARGATSLFVHVDLDVLDPSALAGLSTPEPFGPAVADVVAAVAALRDVAPVRAAALTEFAPSSPDAAVADMGAILRLVGALSGVLR